MRLLLFIFLVVLFSLVVHPGYKVFAGDQEVYLPQIYHLENPSLFENDLLVSFNQIRYTIFDEIIINLKNIFHLDIVTLLFFLTFFARFVYYYSIYKLAFYFFQDKIFSLISLPLFISGFFVYGYPFQTLEIILVPRLISLALNLLFLVLFLNNKKFSSLVPLALAALIHPISSPPFFIFFILGILFGSKKTDCFYLGKILILGLSVILFLLLNNHSFDLSLLIFRPIDIIWKQIIKTRNPYYFISSWNYQLILLLSTFLLFSIVFWEKKEIFKEKIKRNYAFVLFLIPFSILISYFILVEAVNQHFFIQLQLLRSLYLWKIFSVLFFSYFAYKHIKKYPSNFLINFFLIGILSSFLFKSSFIYPLPHKESLVVIFLPLFIYLWTINKYQARKSWIIFLGLVLVTFILSRILMIRIALLIPLLLFVLTISLIIKSQTAFIKRGQYLIKPVISFFLLTITLIYLPYFRIIPEYYLDEPFMEACNWIKNNTTKKDIFISEPFSKKSGPLRLSCFRSVFVCRKDGSFAILFDRNYAIEWKKRMNLISKLKDNYETLLQISNQYNINYIFSDSKLDSGKEEVFGNGKYYIYKIKN